MKLTYLFQNCGKNLKHPVKFIRILILQTLFFSHILPLKPMSTNQSYYPGQETKLLLYIQDNILAPTYILMFPFLLKCNY